MSTRRSWVVVLAVVAGQAPLVAGERGLRAFVEAGLANDLSFQSAVVSSTLGEAQLRATLAAYVPRLVPTYSFSRDEAGNDRQAFGLGVTWDTGFGAMLSGSFLRSELGTTSTAPGWSTDRSIQVTVPLGAQFGRLPARVALEASRASRNASERELKNARQRSIRDVVQTYFAYLQAQKALEVAEQSVERARRNHEITVMKYQLGEVSRVDADRALQLLQQTQFSAVTTRDEVVRIRKVIENVYGVPDVDAYDFRVPPIDRYVPEWEDGEIVRMALAADPAIAGAREQLEVAKLSLKLATRQFLPDIDASYRVGSRDAPANSPAVGASGQYHQVSLMSNFDLDYSARRLGLQNALVTATTQELALRQSEQSLRSQLESQLQAFSHKRDLVELSRRALESARSQALLANLRFEKGIGSAFDVVDSQAQLQGTELQFVAAEVDLIVSYYEILYRLQRLDLDGLIE